jgi:hypothetical protein
LQLKTIFLRKCLDTVGETEYFSSIARKAISKYIAPAAAPGGDPSNKAHFGNSIPQVGFFISPEASFQCQLPPGSI